MDKPETIFFSFLNFFYYLNFLFTIFLTAISYFLFSANYLLIVSSSFKLSAESNPKKEDKKNNKKIKENNAGEYDIEGFHKVIEKEGHCELSELLRDFGKFSEESIIYYKNRRTSPELKNKNGELSLMFIESLSSLNSLNSCSTINNINDYITQSNEVINQKNSFEAQIFEKINWIIEPSQEKEDPSDPHITSRYLYPNLNKNNEIINDQNSSDEYEILKKQFKLGVIREFEFDNNNNKKTCIVKELNEKIFKVFSQGEPELIKSFCLEKTIPKDYDNIVKSYQTKGKKVLAFCGKQMKMNYLQAQKIGRKNCESNMIFLGFIIYKYDSYKAFS